MLCELELHEYDAPSDLQFPILVVHKYWTISPAPNVRDVEFLRKTPGRRSNTAPIPEHRNTGAIGPHLMLKASNIRSATISAAMIFLRVQELQH